MAIPQTSDFPTTLRHCRDMLIEATGREDLITAAGADAGANKFINMGIRFLADRQPGRKGYNSRVRDLNVGTTRFSVFDAQAINRVWMSDSDGMWELLQLSYNDFRNEYPELMKDVDTTQTPPIESTAAGSGTPNHWCIAASGPAPVDNWDDSTTWADNDDITYDYYDITPGDHYNTTIILFAPIPDQAYTIRVYGNFYPATLTQDGDQNYWTMMHPELVVQAAAYQMEVFFRNTAGQRDWLFAINQALIGLHRSETREEMGTITKIKG